MDYLRVFASRPTVVGRTLGELHLPGENCAVVLHVRRGDTDLLAQPNLVLEFGDRVGLLANRERFVAMRKFLGDSIKSTAEFSYISIGLAMALGFLIGALQVPLSIIGKLVVGLAGVLIVALILGNLRRTGGVNWTIPLSANPRSAKFRVNPVPRTGRNVFRVQVCHDGFGNWLPDARVRHCCAHCSCSAHHGPWPVCIPDAVRRGGGNCCRRLW